MLDVGEDVCAASPRQAGGAGEEQPQGGLAPPKMFKIVKMCKLRWQVLLVEAPEGQRYPFGLERCLSVNAIRKPSQQLRHPRRWSALLPAASHASASPTVLRCGCRAISGDGPPVGRGPYGDVEATAYRLDLKGTTGRSSAAGPVLCECRCPKHGDEPGSPEGPEPGGAEGPEPGSPEGPEPGGPDGPEPSDPDRLCRAHVAAGESAPREQCRPVVGSSSHPKAKKSLRSDGSEKVQSSVPPPLLVRRESLRTAPPLTNKIKLLSKETMISMKSRKAFNEARMVQALANKKCPKCPFCYQHHD